MTHRVQGHLRLSLLLFTLLAIGACSSQKAGPADRRILATVSGLRGVGLVLQTNGANDVTVSANDGTIMADRTLVLAYISSGASYDVTIKEQPQKPSQSCVVTNGSGTVGASDVSNISIACTGGAYDIIASVSGPVGQGLALQETLHGSAPVTVTEDGEVTVVSQMMDGSFYNVVVSSQPANQSCTVSSASGQLAGANATVAVTCTDLICSTTGQCAPRYTVGITGPSGTAVLGAGEQKITVTVVRATKDVKNATAVVLSADGKALSGAPIVTSLSDTVDTYAWVYTPPSGVEEDVTFTATATGPGADASTTISVNAPDLKLAVDTKPPSIAVIPDNGGSFAGGTDMTFQVKIADAHPPTEQLSAMVGTTGVALTYQASDAGVSVYRGVLTRAAMQAAGLGCSVSVTVTARDTAGNFSTSSPAQMSFACAGSTVCSPEETYTCQPKYTVTIVSPVANTLFSTTTQQTVTFNVKRGTAAVSVPQVDLTAVYSTGTVDLAARSAQSTTGLNSTYSWTYSPPNGIEGDVTLAATVVGSSPAASSSVKISIDNAAPSVLVGGLTNPARYLRTDTIRFSVRVSDNHLSSPAASLTATLSAVGGGGGGAVLMTTTLQNPSSDSAGYVYSGAFDLSQQPTFNYYEQQFAISVTASDAYGHSATKSDTQLKISRLRWSTVVNQGDVTSPAVLKDGDLVVGRTVASSSPSVAKLSRSTGVVTFATAKDLVSSVTSPPAVGSTGVFVSTGTGLCWTDTNLATSACCPNAFAATPAITMKNSKEVAVAEDSGGRLEQITVSPSFKCTVATAGNGGSPDLSPVFSGTSMYFSDGYQVKSAPQSDDNGIATWGTAIYHSVTGALAVDGSAIWAVAIGDGGAMAKLDLGNGTYLKSFFPLNVGTQSVYWAYPAGGWPVLAGLNDVLIGRTPNSGGSGMVLARLGGGYTGSWATSPLDGASAYSDSVGPLVLRTSGNNQTFLVPTSNGSLYQLDQAGNTVWSWVLATASLHDANIAADINDSSRKFSTAYFGSASGTVYAVIVDGVLDATAPWPKVRHDPQNTGNTTTTIVP